MEFKFSAGFPSIELSLEFLDDIDRHSVAADGFSYSPRSKGGDTATLGSEDHPARKECDEGSSQPVFTSGSGSVWSGVRVPE
jgi:hypothetical protein